MARGELRRLLAGNKNLEIVGEASDAEEAREQLQKCAPDVIFLDVQMPGETGLEFLETMEPPMPQVIFTTAYDEFAVKAFEPNALDHLLKPVDPARLASAVERPAVLQPEDKVFVREGDNCWFVEVKRIRLLESEGNYTRVHFDEAQPQLFRSLNAMESRLNAKSFFRANRRQMINLE